MDQKRTIGKFTVFGKAGEGAFGKVWKATKEDDGHLFAIKEVSKSEMAEATYQNLLREVQISKAMDHPGLSHCILTMESKTSFYMVFELCEGEDLERYIREKRIPQAEALSIARQLRNAYQFLYEHGVLHRDLKPENVLFVDKAKTRIRISDFGSSKAALLGSTVIGTPKYMAPEVIQEDSKYDYKADIWSFALCVWELMFGQSAYPFSLQSKPALEADMRAHSGENLRFPNETIDPVVRDFFVKCLQLSPQARIDAALFFSHPFFDLYPDSDASHSHGTSGKMCKPVRYLQDRAAEAAACNSAARDLLRWIPEPHDHALTPALYSSALLLTDRAKRRCDNIVASLEGGKNPYELEDFAELASKTAETAPLLRAVKEMSASIANITQIATQGLKDAKSDSLFKKEAVEALITNPTPASRKLIMDRVAEATVVAAPEVLKEQRLAAFQTAFNRILALMGYKRKSAK